MNREIETMEMMQSFKTSQCNLLSGLKEKDRSLCNLKLGEWLFLSKFHSFFLQIELKVRSFLIKVSIFFCVDGNCRRDGGRVK